MSSQPTERTRTFDRLAANLGRVGGVLGLVAGIVEVTAGSSIRPWIGNKNDPTRLGIVTVVLAAIALASAGALAASDRSLRPSRRLGIVAGMLLPALVCFTTVGRLWYVPGALLVAAGVLAASGLRGELRGIAREIDHDATRILAITLAVIYLALGLTAFGSTGLIGVVGALVVAGLLVVRPRVDTPVTVALLLTATVPFAVTTWWSIVTPILAVLIVIIGSAAVTCVRTPGAAVEAQRSRAPRARTGVGAESVLRGGLGATETHHAALGTREMGKPK
jgi:hypothetical protein